MLQDKYNTAAQGTIETYSKHVWTRPGQSLITAPICRQKMKSNLLEYVQGASTSSTSKCTFGGTLFRSARSNCAVLYIPSWLNRAQIVAKNLTMLASSFSFYVCTLRRTECWPRLRTLAIVRHSLLTIRMLTEFNRPDARASADIEHSARILHRRKVYFSTHGHLHGLSMHANLTMEYTPRSAYGRHPNAHSLSTNMSETVPGPRSPRTSSLG